MDKKSFKHMRRRELLEMLLMQSKEINRLRETVEELSKTASSVEQSPKDTSVKETNTSVKQYEAQTEQVKALEKQVEELKKELQFQKETVLPKQSVPPNPVLSHAPPDDPWAELERCLKSFDSSDPADKANAESADDCIRKGGTG